MVDCIAASKETTEPKETETGPQGYARAGLGVGELCSNAPAEQVPGPVVLRFVGPSAKSSARCVHEPVEEETKAKEDRSKEKEIVDEGSGARCWGSFI